MPPYVFDELYMQYLDIMQLQRILSQDWMRYWDRLVHIQDMLSLCEHKHSMQSVCVNTLSSKLQASL